MASRARFFVFDVILLVLFTLVLVFFRSVDYGVHQLVGQLNIIQQARPVSEVLEDSSVPDSLKAKLRFIQSVEQFGVTYLGLHPTRNYRTFYDQHGKPILWVVTASEKYRLVPYTWNFPLLGTVSYKGFFEESRARELSQELQLVGYDVYAYDVEAWSTLGWFSDPIMSGMLDRDEGRLAELVLHELTHATIFLKGKVDLNENLASFVGEQGALSYLRQTHGDTSLAFLHYQQKLLRDQRITQHMIRGAQRLTELYASGTFVGSSHRDSLKRQCLKEILFSLDTLGEQSLRQRWSKRKLNNAHFLSYLRYDAQKDSLKYVMDSQFGGRLDSAIQTWKREWQP